MNPFTAITCTISKQPAFPFPRRLPKRHPDTRNRTPATLSHPTAFMNPQHRRRRASPSQRAPGHPGPSPQVPRGPPPPPARPPLTPLPFPDRPHGEDVRARVRPRQSRLPAPTIRPERDRGGGLAAGEAAQEEQARQAAAGPERGR